MRPIATPIAIWAADKHVTQKLHLDFLEPRAPPALALPLPGIKTQRAGVQPTLFGDLRLRNEFPNVIECPDINRWIRSRLLLKNNLVNQHHAHKLLTRLQHVLPLDDLHTL